MTKQAERKWLEERLLAREKGSGRGKDHSAGRKEVAEGKITKQGERK